ncbi:hypothetical protein [Haloterrigena salifodinae]|nr:hypothetical protein [Haloterrigena salifodinae]
MTGRGRPADVEFDQQEIVGLVEQEFERAPIIALERGELVVVVV